MLLLKQKHLLVDGEIYKYPVYEPDGKTFSYTEKALHLVFSLQVNGEMRRFENSFALENPEHAVTSDDLELENWNEWYFLVRILEEFGYSFKEDNDTYGNYTIRKWIEKIQKEDKDKVFSE